ncbi:hypothetical protein GHK92_18195 [Nocardioides sp. dk4132]|uniref:hypothetical protein n=1 Tax=unclassified Nocardioides TaxID=2615069 RepID=UPI001297DA7B|nr:MULTISPECIES: hypothetical protein [unclassified Nocardioides]MQW77806.1 hypothetical protein [Nocardioides sp. dk4132]QGA08200.1 hypothetical protein GFH29_12900 [Nocardioides sp. dk884]
MDSDGTAAVLYSPRRARALHVALWAAFLPSALVTLGALAEVLADGREVEDRLPLVLARALVGLVLLGLCVLGLRRLEGRDRATRVACVLLGVALIVLAVPLLGLGVAFVMPLGGLALLALALLPGTVTP